GPGRAQLLRQPERLGTRVLVRHDLQPAMPLQRLDVAAEGGGVQLQNLADLDRRTAMHVLEIVSMLLARWSMIVRLPGRHDDCICNYRPGSRGFSRDSGVSPTIPESS